LGLTGGIGSGKSTVARILKDSGAVVIDADALGHEALESPRVKAALVRDFGPGILGEDGRIDRPELGRRAFRSRASVARLNRQVHPWILARIRRTVAGTRGRVVLDASLLFEAGVDRWCDQVWFVDAPRSVRERRVRSRGWSPRELARRERFQAAPEEKKRKSDVVIDNGGALSRTARTVRRLLKDFEHSQPS
jgi:dephospho-CoA kinase